MLSFTLCCFIMWGLPVVLSEGSEVLRLPGNKAEPSLTPSLCVSTMVFQDPDGKK